MQLHQDNTSSILMWLVMYIAWIGLYTHTTIIIQLKGETSFKGTNCAQKVRVFLEWDFEQRLPKNWKRDQWWANLQLELSVRISQGLIQINKQTLYGYAMWISELMRDMNLSSISLWREVFS